MANIGYARVSSQGQSLEVQLNKLNDCNEIFKETISGVDSKRPKLQECLRYVRKGDTLVVTKIDRLARSITHFAHIIETLKEKEVELIVLDQNIDTSTSTGRLTLNVLASFAQFETEIRAERQADGIKKAQERGIKFGGKYRLSEEKRQELIKKRQEGASINELMECYEIKRRTVYDYLERASQA